MTATEAPGLDLGPMLDRVSDMVVVVRVESGGRYRCMGVNRAFLQVTGKHRGDAVGKPLDEIVAPADRTRTRAHYDEAVRVGLPMRFEDRIDLPEGRRVFDVQLTPVFDVGGSAYVLSVSRDVTKQRAAEAALRASEARLEALVEHSSDMITVMDETGRVVYGSPSITTVLGWPHLGFDATEDERAAAQSPWDLIHPDDLERVATTWAEAIAEGRARDRIEFRMRRADEEWRWIEAIASNRIDDPAVRGIVVNSRDVTERHEAEDELRARQRELSSLLEGSPDLIARFDSGLRHVYVNPAVSDATGFPRDEMLGRTMAELGADPRLTEIWDPNLRRAFETGAEGEFEYPFRGPHGLRWYHTRTAPETGPDGTIETVLAVIRDVTDRKEMEKALTHQALHDPLTGLPNRLLLLDRVDQSLRRLTRSGGHVAVLFLDLDRFKVVNDSLGHAAGDRLLVDVSERLAAASRPGDTVARFGGDEFVVLCDDLSGRDAAATVAARFAEALREPFVYDGRRLPLTASIGIAASSRSGADAAELLRDADAAMYRAKERGRDRYEFFDAGLRDQAVARLDLELELQHALEHGELRVAYQPIVDLDGDRVVAVEGLLRWQHPRRGWLEPDEFLPVAEETGLIVPIGAWALDRACRDVAAWTQERTDLALPALCVNLSVRQLGQHGLVEHVAAMLADTGIEPGRMCVEITETVLMRDDLDAEGTLGDLHALGVRIALDDFGTGYSSLGYLRRFPVDIIKIDRSFVDGLGCDRECAAIVQAVAAMARALRLVTVAEGVETAGQLEEARRLGIDRVQGNVFSPPVPVERLAELPTDASALRRAGA